MLAKKIPAIIYAFSEVFPDLYLSPIRGIPSILRTIIALKNSRSISTIYLASDIPNIISFCLKYGVKILSSNTKNIDINYVTISKLSDYISKSEIEFSETILVNARYPFLSTAEVDKVIQPILDGYKFSYAIRQKRYNILSVNQISEGDYESFFYNDMQSLYAVNKSDSLSNINLIPKNKICSVEIDWSIPFLIYEKKDLPVASRLFNTIVTPKTGIIDPTQLKFVFLDFDGVLTDNYILSDKNGNEVVKTSKYDSYAIGRLINEFGIYVCIITSELSPTHKKRAEKINVPIIQSKSPKHELIKPILTQNFISNTNKNTKSPQSIFIGNDINDLCVLPFIDLFCCPSDSHPEVLSKSDVVLESKGGEAVVRELVELISNVY
tara:strand:+ start:562 stop:1704 length:1143 start_codon:yes stop_codon:yes gene_type:complete